MSSYSVRDERDLADLVAGPVFGGFSEWLLRTAQERDLRHLFFASREGHFLRQYWQEAALANSEAGISSEYLLTSRISLAACTFTDAESLPALLRHPYEGAREAFIRNRLGIVDDRLIVELGRLLPARLDLAHDRQRVEDVLADPSALAQDVCSSNADQMRDALDASGFSGATDSALIDVGYSGTIPFLLARVVGSDAFTKLYVIGTTSFHSLHHSYSFFGCSHWDSGHPVIDVSLLLEGLLQAPHGSLLGYRKGKAILASAQGAEGRAVELARVHDLAIDWWRANRDITTDFSQARRTAVLGLSAYLHLAVAEPPTTLQYLAIDDAATGDTEAKTWVDQAREWLDRVGGFRNWQAADVALCSAAASATVTAGA